MPRDRSLASHPYINKDKKDNPLYISYEDCKMANNHHFPPSASTRLEGVYGTIIDNAKKLLWELSVNLEEPAVPVKFQFQTVG